MRYQLHFSIRFWCCCIFAEVANKHKWIEHVFVRNMNFFFSNPRFSLAIRTTVVSIRNDFEISMTKYPFTFITFPWIIKRNAITYRAGYELSLEEGIFGYPFLIDSDEIRLVIRFLAVSRFLVSLLHDLIDNQMRC